MVAEWVPERHVPHVVRHLQRVNAILKLAIESFGVLETLTPAERLAFVLHDMFGVPFDEIGEILERTPEASRQLASRARRRVRGRAPVADPDLDRQRQVVEAFLTASRKSISLVSFAYGDGERGGFGSRQLRALREPRCNQ